MVFTAWSPFKFCLYINPISYRFKRYVVHGQFISMMWPLSLNMFYSYSFQSISTNRWFFTIDVSLIQYVSMRHNVLRSYIFCLTTTYVLKCNMRKKSKAPIFDPVFLICNEYHSIQGYAINHVNSFLYVKISKFRDLIDSSYKKWKVNQHKMSFVMLHAIPSGQL